LGIANIKINNHEPGGISMTCFPNPLTESTALENTIDTSAGDLYRGIISHSRKNLEKACG